MSPFIMQSFKKIVGADFEKIDKVDFRHIQTYGGYLIGPSPAGGPKECGKIEKTDRMNVRSMVK